MNYLSNHASAVFAEKILEDCANNAGLLDKIEITILREICRPDSGRIILDNAEADILNYLLAASYEIDTETKAAYRARAIDYYEYLRRNLNMVSARKQIFTIIEGENENEK